MASSFKYWDDCVDPRDMEAMWMDPEVFKEWTDVGETKGNKVHLSRDPDGQPYLTQIEMKAVAQIVVNRQLRLQLDTDMICALAEIESDRQLLVERYNKKIKESTVGIMQVLQTTAEMLFRDVGYRSYQIEGNPDLLYRPFVNIYYGAAYLKYLYGYDGKERDEEFVVRAYRGGPKKAAHKSTSEYFQRYLSVKQSLPSRKLLESRIPGNNLSVPDVGPVPKAGETWTYWDSRASAEDMEEMWRHPEVLKEWTKSGERRGRVRFSQDKEKRPYLSRPEVKAVAEIIVSRHFGAKSVRPTALCAICELCSMRFLNGVGARIGLMGIDYSTAAWLYKNLGYKAYKVASVDDLYNPFVSMYFGTAYVAWLSEYEGRERTAEFVVQAYLGGPENVNLQETGPLWRKFRETISYYEDPRRERGSCTIS